MKTKILAVMFTDIAGYTQRTNSQTYEENAELLEQHAAVVHPLIKRFGGDVVKEMGDAVLAIFRSPTQAVEAAMAVQDRLAEINAAREAGEQVHLRIAINVGEVRVDGNDVFGDGVNVTARLEAETPEDEIYITAATYLTMNRSSVPLEPLGQLDLKGIAEPVSVFRLPRYASRRAHEEDAVSLPYGGRQLDRLAVQRRQGRLRKLALAACIAVVAAMGGQQGWQWWTQETRRAEVVAAASRHDWHRATTLLEELHAVGADTAEPTAVVLREIRASNDPARACLALEMLGTLLAEEPGRRETVARLRLHHGFGLISMGELAQAHACLEQVALVSTSPSARILELDRIHLGTLQALRSRTMDALKSGLERYEGFLLSGGAPDEHRALIAEIAAESYSFAETRPLADSLVVEHLREAAATALAQRAMAARTPPAARNWLVARLESIAGAFPLDWTPIDAAQLDTPSCGARKNAIERIRERGRLSAVGLLMRELAKRQACTRDVARAAINHLVETGEADIVPGAAVAATLVATR